MVKLGVSKNKLLSDPNINMLYQQFIKKQKGMGKMKGAGLWDSFVGFLKDSKILSKVGDVLLPVGGALLGGLLSGNPLAAGVGAAAGSSASEFLKSKGFGKMRGGDSRLVINPAGQRLGQRGSGMTYSYNGVYTQIPKMAGSGKKMMGCGGVQYGSISSDFGKIKV